MISEKFCLIFAFSFLALATLAAEVRKYQEDFFILHNPCWYKHCHPYATCKVNGSEAICVCPSKCTRILRPVCGTNWRTYNNLCELIAKSCAGNEKTRYRYNGECKAGDCKGTRWESLRCPYYSKCRLNYGLPSCFCPKQRCSYVYKPVCGTNGRTYRNSCFLREQACRNRRWLRIRHAGHCKPDPCNKLDCCCGAKCRVNEDNRATCECDILCPQIYQPVCGSDGKTYGNGCNLRSAACARQNPKLVESGFGPCLKPTVHPCAAVSCSSYAKCEVINGTGQCVCPRGCPEIYQPVCGSDHVTYSNECELNRTNCLQNKTTTVAKKGPCSPRTLTPTITPCATVKCGFYATCKVVRGQPRCTCSNPCPGVSDPVCGSDNHTYENECDLRRTSCKDQRSISVVKKGFCEPETSCPIPRICLVFCDEADCAKKGQICCCQGCGSVCTTPIKSPVSGLNVCPPDPLACRKDSDCSGGKKCCSIGCSTRCTSVKG